MRRSNQFVNKFWGLCLPLSGRVLMQINTSLRRRELELSARYQWTIRKHSKYDYSYYYQSLRNFYFHLSFSLFRALAGGRSFNGIISGLKALQGLLHDKRDRRDTFFPLVTHEGDIIIPFYRFPFNYDEVEMLPCWFCVSETIGWTDIAARRLRNRRKTKFR